MNLTKRGFEANVFQMLTNIDFLVNQYWQMQDEGKDTKELLANSKYEFLGKKFKYYSNA